MFHEFCICFLIFANGFALLMRVPVVGYPALLNDREKTRKTPQKKPQKPEKKRKNPQILKSRESKELATDYLIWILTGI